MKEAPTILIGVPLQSTFFMLPDFHYSLVKAVTHTLEHDLASKFFFYYPSGCNVAKNRNLIWNHARVLKPDYLFMVDADMIFKYHTIQRMLERSEQRKDKMVISGLARKGSPPYDYAVFDKELQPVKDITTTPFFPHAIGSFGMLIPQKVFKKFSNPFSRLEDYEEDISFCMKLEEMGVPLLCDPSIYFGHLRAETVKPGV